MSVMRLALRFGMHIFLHDLCFIKFKTQATAVFNLMPRRLNSFLKKMLSKRNDRVTEVLCHII